MTENDNKIGHVIKGHCPTCGPDRNAEIICHHYDPWHYQHDEANSVSGGSSYYILKCRGCDDIYYKKSSWCSEDIDYYHNPYTGETEQRCAEEISYWPSPIKRATPSWLDDLKFFDRDLGGLFDDIYSALNHDLPILAAIAMRTTFDRASELLGIDPALRFFEKLDALEKSGKVGKDERTILDILTDAGGAAAHRGWKPSPKELETMISIIEQFLYRLFILQDAAGDLKKSVPQKQKKKKP